MSYFVIKHLPTGYYLPNARGRDGRGFTHVEPSPSNVRLFGREQDAKVALKWWLQGKLTVTPCSTSWETPDIHDDEDWSFEPIESRKAEDMRVVEVVLQEKPL